MQGTGLLCICCGVSARCCLRAVARLRGASARCLLGGEAMGRRDGCAAPSRLCGATDARLRRVCAARRMRGSIAPVRRDGCAAPSRLRGVTDARLHRACAARRMRGSTAPVRRDGCAASGAVGWVPAAAASGPHVKQGVCACACACVRARVWWWGWGWGWWWWWHILCVGERALGRGSQRTPCLSGVDVDLTCACSKQPNRRVDCDGSERDRVCTKHRVSIYSLARVYKDTLQWYSYSIARYFTVVLVQYTKGTLQWFSYSVQMVFTGVFMQCTKGVLQWYSYSVQRYFTVTVYRGTRTVHKDTFILDFYERDRAHACHISQVCLFVPIRAELSGPARLCVCVLLCVRAHYCVRVHDCACVSTIVCVRVACARHTQSYRGVYAVYKGCFTVVLIQCTKVTLP
jgi:hypothetical protein